MPLQQTHSPKQQTRPDPAVPPGRGRPMQPGALPASYMPPQMGLSMALPPCQSPERQAPLLLPVQMRTASRSRSPSPWISTPVVAQPARGSPSSSPGGASFALPQSSLTTVVNAPENRRAQLHASGSSVALGSPQQSNRVLGSPQGSPVGSPSASPPPSFAARAARVPPKSPVLPSRMPPRNAAISSSMPSVRPHDLPEPLSFTMNLRRQLPRNAQVRPTRRGMVAPHAAAQLQPGVCRSPPRDVWYRTVTTPKQAGRCMDPQALSPKALQREMLQGPAAVAAAVAAAVSRKIDSKRTAAGHEEKQHPESVKDTTSQAQMSKALKDVIAPPPRDAINRFLEQAFVADSTSSSSKGKKKLRQELGRPRMHLELYWEKRRIQNLLRRLFEAMLDTLDDEAGGLVSSSSSKAEDNNMSVRDLGKVFDLLVSALPSSGPSNSQECELDVKSFELALNASEFWPRDLGKELIGEVFSALCHASTADVAMVLNGAAPRTVLCREKFIKGFEHVPFNLPDFPVPTHFLAWDPKPSDGTKGTEIAQELSTQIAEALALTFCAHKTGIGAVKDFFLTGLLSLEELQAAMPISVPNSALEEAVTLIVDAGSAFLSDDEWQELVLEVRTPEACNGSGSDAQRASNAQGLAEILAMSAEARSFIAGAVSGHGDFEELRQLEAAALALKAEPAVPVAGTAQKLDIAALSRPIINWSTVGDCASSGEAKPPGGADAAAGQDQNKILSRYAHGKAPTSQAMAWLNLGLHHECAGPFLADAFVRCCELYHLSQTRQIDAANAGL